MNASESATSGPSTADGSSTPDGLATGATGARGRRRRWPFLVGALVLVLLIALAPWLWIRARAAGGVHHLDQAPSAQVSLVLGAGVVNNQPSPFLAARLDVAIALYRAGRTKVLLVSGDNRFSNYDEPTVMRNYLVAHQIPSARVVLDYAGRDTYDSCARAKRIFGVDQLLIVSQGYHLPRAVTTCRALGVSAEGVGDWTMTTYTQTWDEGALREVPASWKTVWDLLSHRDPAVLGHPEDGVRRALSSGPG